MVPTHVAIIPDGNRRWAREKGKGVMEGHEAGAEAFRAIALHAADCGVKHLSVWGLSLENAKKRSLREMAGLMNIFRKQFMSLKESDDIHSRQVKINVFGWWQKQFPARVRHEIEAAISATEHYSSYFLNFFLAYSGTNEMALAIQNILRNPPAKVTDETIKHSLLTKDLPAVDLVIRTGGEPHLSAGFMMWDVADAELYFPEVHWPDFTPAEFDKALEFYASRERRFGK
ncbi:MAG: polyprenyl diphosphate synthase [Patescibacteria group bacterium]|mgnify:FL=1